MTLKWLRNRIGVIFGVFEAFAVLDAVLVGAFPDYRNALGTTEGLVGTFLRIVPDLLLVAVYAWYFRMKNETDRLRMVKVHSWVFIFVGMAMLVPWLGMFFVVISPIAFLYFGPLIYLPGGVWISYLAVVGFLLLNLGLLISFSKSNDVAPTD